MSGLPENWEVTSLANVCEILDSQRVPINNKERNQRTEGKSQDQLFPYYGATGQVGVIDDFIFDGEYVLLGEDGAPFLDHTRDTAYMVDGKFWVNNHAHILKAYVSNKYLCYYLNQVDYSEYVTGTTRLKLNQAQLKEIQIKFAPLAEQKRIVAKIEELFSELDKGIENLKTAREQLKVYRQAVLKHAFEGKLTANWREKNRDKLETADELLERIKQERETTYQQQLEEWEASVKAWERNAKKGKKPVRPRKQKDVSSPNEEELKAFAKLPPTWKWVKLGELVWSVKDGPHYTPQYSEQGIPFITGGNVRPTGVDFDNVKYISEGLHKELSARCKPELGDLLYTKGGTTGIARVTCRNQMNWLKRSLKIWKRG